MNEKEYQNSIVIIKAIKNTKKKEIDTLEKHLQTTCDHKYPNEKSAVSDNNYCSYCQICYKVI